MKLLLGLITGIVFGFLLQKARVLRYDKQIGALRLKDMTIVKFMLSHIMVAMVGIYLLQGFGMVNLSPKATVLGANILGGLIFGLGWGLVGYCPGTAAGALGEGRIDAIFAMLGMLVGASLFAHTYPWLKATVYTWGAFGKITLPPLLGINQWLIIAVLLVVYAMFLRFLERKQL